MIEFMDGIVEAVEQFVEGVGENALIILGILVKIVTLITAPVWILPYKLIRDIAQDKNGGKCESPDCDRCPFPPCEEREALKHGRADN